MCTINTVNVYLGFEITHFDAYHFDKDSKAAVGKYSRIMNLQGKLKKCLRL